MKRKIIYEKWINPLSVESNKNLENDDEDESDFEEEPTYKDSYTKLEEQQNGKLLHGFSGPVFIGPAGVVPINPESLADKQYNLYIAHTNFKLTYPLLKEIESVLGVEVLRPFSPYRFWLGIGKAFDELTVKRDIYRAINPPESLDVEVDKARTLDLLRSNLQEKYICYALSINKKGEIKIFGGNSPKEILTLLAKNRNEEETELITSWD